MNWGWVWMRLGVWWITGGGWWITGGGWWIRVVGLLLTCSLNLWISYDFSLLIRI
jgi:hypothetical protein